MMPPPAIPLSRTKVIVPKRRAEILTRPRLLGLLDKLLEKRLILVSAPAGYGKTSLLIDCAAHAEMPLCWLSLDALDRDPQRFIAYFIASIAEAFPAFGRQSAAALGSLASPEGDGERLIVTLVNEIAGQVSEHFILVVDDFQFVNDTPAVRDFVNRFAQLVGENCHLVLSSRKVVALPDTVLMLAREQVDGLGPLELAFAAPEIQSLFAQNYRIELSDAAAEDLAQQTEGWITALQFSGPALAAGAADRLRAARAAGVGLPDYLNREVLAQQPPELREFLLQTSLLDEFDANLCAAVLAPLRPGRRRNWKQMVASVRSSNLFALPVGPEGRWLRYHHLFQDFLQARLREERPGLAEAILRRLAEVHEQGGELEKSYHACRQLGDANALAGLVERGGSILLAHDRTITLSLWLESLPAEIIRARPALLSLQGSAAALSGQEGHGLGFFDEAEAAFRAAGDIPNRALNLMRRAYACRLLGDYPAALADAEEALRLAPGDGSLASIRAEALRVKGLSLHRGGQIGAAVECLTQSLEIYNSLREKRAIPKVQMELGMARHAAGDHKIAQSHFEQALSIWQREGDLFWRANLLNNMGVLFHSQGEYESAARAFEEGLQCAKRSGYTRMEVFILAGLGDLLADLDEVDAARQSYRQSRELAGRTDTAFLSRYLPLAQAGLARAQAAYAEAQTLLERVQESIAGSGSLYEKGLFHLERGCFLLAVGRTDEAIRDLLAAEQFFDQGGLVVEAAQSRLWLAAAYGQAKDEARAREKMRAALIAAAPERPAHALVTAARRIRGMFPDFRDEPEVGNALADLLKEADRVNAQLPALRRRLRRGAAAVQSPYPRLAVRAFGRPQVRINGRLVTPSQWQTQEIRDLFFYFFHTTRALTKEQVGAEFWPEFTPEQLRVRFKNDIYRLRRALGPDTILFEDNLYQFNPTLDHEYDVGAFEAQIAKAKAAQDLRQRIACYQSAVALVKGPFLEDNGAAWAGIERERLNREFLAALSSLAKLYLESGNWTRALQSCQGALAGDPCLEEFHRQAMLVYAAMGDRATIARQYQACKGALDAELDVPPSPETEALYRKLMS
jgi:ATP/maltotriose-dependent transcriptional regulator MalT/two-component SAPR family response regulator